MVSPLPLEEQNAPHHDAPPAPHEEPFVEQFFPQQMSWYAAEGPQGKIEDVGRWIRENPLAAVGLAVAAGLGVALLASPLFRLGAQGLEAMCGTEEQDTDAAIER